VQKMKKPNRTIWRASPASNQRDWPRIQQALDAIDRPYDEQVDKCLAPTFLQQYLAPPAGEQDAALCRHWACKQA